MKRAVIGVIVLSVVMALFTYAPARAELSAAEKGRFGLETIMWWPQMVGEISLDTEKMSGTTLNLADDLDMNSVGSTFVLNAYFNLTKRNRFSFNWFLDQRSGTLELAKNVKVAGFKFAEDTKIDSELDVQRYRLLYERALIRRDQGRIAIGIGVSYFDAAAQVEGTTVADLHKSVSKDLQFILPVIAAAAELHLPLGFGLFAEGCGFGLDYSDVSGRYFDARGGVNWKSRFVFAQAGYQYFLLSAVVLDKINMSYSLLGPFASVGAKF